MGQRHGKAVYDGAAKPFLNLSLAAVGTLWETFNDVADGFGINLHEFREICAELGEELKLNRAQLDKVCCIRIISCTTGERYTAVFLAVRYSIRLELLELLHVGRLQQYRAVTNVTVTLHTSSLFQGYSIQVHVFGAKSLTSLPRGAPHRQLRSWSLTPTTAVLDFRLYF